jgi:hypothetical protein
VAAKAEQEQAMNSNDDNPRPSKYGAPPSGWLDGRTPRERANMGRHILELVSAFWLIVALVVAVVLLTLHANGYGTTPQPNNTTNAATPHCPNTTSWVLIQDANDDTSWHCEPVSNN